MAFFNKRMILLFTNLFLLAGIGTTILNNRLLNTLAAPPIVAKFGNTVGRLTSGWNQSSTFSLGGDYAGFRTSNSTYSSANFLEANISNITSIGFLSNITVDSKIGGFGFSSTAVTGDYATGTITKGTLRAAFFNSSNQIVGSSADGNFHLTSATESYTQSTDITLTQPSRGSFSNISYFRIWLASDTGFTGSKYMRFEEITLSFTEGALVTAFTISPETSTILGIGNTQQLTASFTPTNSTNKSIVWTSSNESVASVNSSGLVTAIAVGSTTITATTEDGSFTDTSIITVESVTQVSSISVALDSATISSGASTQATETILPAEAAVKTVTWTSSNTSIATVNSSGLVTANSGGLAGTSIIRATATDGSGVFGEATVTVNPVNVTGVSLAPETATIVGLGNTQQLTVTISPNNSTNKNITWSSSDNAIATVNSSGLVTSVAAGVVTITATTEDGSFTDFSTINVSYVPASGITLSSNEVTLYTAGTFRTTTLIATVAPENATDKTVTWSSSNVAVASVNSSGLVTGLTVGSATITATSNDNNTYTATASITVVARTLTNVIIKTNTSKTTFALGENLYSPSLVLTISYNDTTSEDVTSGYSLTGYNSKQLGTQTVTVTYPGYSGTNPTYNVFVSNVESATPTVATDLFISEYIEGTGNNKAIEIFNGTGAGVSLSNYKLRVHANGATSTTDITLGSTTLPNNATFVIANPSANGSITALADDITGSINFNGDDAVSLYKVSSATNIDVIGTIGVDPGTEFTGQAANGDGTTLDKTITRTANIYQPSSTFKFQEWNVSSIDTISNLDMHTFTPLTSTEQSQAFADYLEQFTTCNLSGPVSIPTLVAEYNAMTASSKTAFASITIDDYDNDAYITNASSYSGLTRTATVNALTKLNKIKDLYNDQNPGNIQTLSARFNPEIQTNFLHPLLFILISTLMLSLFYFSKIKFIKNKTKFKILK